jgi:hypothetical protein
MALKTFMARVCEVEEGTETDTAVFVREMMKYRGRILKFRRSSVEGYELVCDPQWVWDRKWIHRVPSERPKPKKSRKARSKKLFTDLNLWNM